MMKRVVAALIPTALVLPVSLLVLSACATSSDSDVGATFNPPPPPVSRPLPKPEADGDEAPPPRSQPPAFKPISNDQCGADALQYLIGKSRTEIPVPLNPGNRRVVCSSCVITQDYRADRQTIIFDTDTGLITSVKCG